MSTDTAFMTKSIPADKEGEPPIPKTEAERYLYALLETQDGLNTALDALAARMAYATARETDDIRLSMAEIRADYLKFAAMKTAYLSKGAMYKAIGSAQVMAIREIINRMQGFTADKDKASAIVDSVTALLANWKKGPPPAGPAGADADPIATLDEKIKVR